MGFVHDDQPSKEKFFHAPVLAQACIEGLAIKPDGIYVDGTLGGGGHAERILQYHPSCQVIGLDYDDDAIRFASLRLQVYGERMRIVKENFRNMKSLLHSLGIACVDGILLDLGVSSFQLDESEKGFSYRFDAPLDMRADSRLTVTAADLIRKSNERELADLFFYYGEERYSRRIARRIVERRERQPILTTGDLSRLVESLMKGPHIKKTLSRIFQALRIAVNDELNNLRQALNDAASLLKPGGRMAVITYHSLEDRIVKQAFRCRTTAAGVWYPLTPKPIVPDETEQNQNPRARSAKLRIAERTNAA